MAVVAKGMGVVAKGVGVVAKGPQVVAKWPSVVAHTNDSPDFSTTYVRNPQLGRIFSIQSIKRYFHAEWPNRAVYHARINTAIGDEQVIQAIMSFLGVCRK